MIFLGTLRSEVRAASWFAALGERPTDGDRADARDYAETEEIDLVRSWREAEDFLKSPTAPLDWWEREEALRADLLSKAKALHPEHALWTSLTDLTTEAGDLVHGKAAAAAARMGGAQAASIHVAAGAASQAVFQVAISRMTGSANPLFESKFRIFAAGRWPLGRSGSRLVLF